MVASKTYIPDDDGVCDKYTKSSMTDPSVRSKKDSNAIYKLDHKAMYVSMHIFLFACFVLASFLVFVATGIYHFNILDSERFVMLQIEILGLVVLRAKIQTQKSVSGISATTFLMYAIVYLCRTILGMWSHPPWDPKFELDKVGCDPILGIFSFLLVLDILKSIFVTHRDTYDNELDTCKAWHAVPACFALTLLIRVSFEEWDFVYQYFFTTVLYIDVLALMPQVVMMAMSRGKVTTPVADFVAATAISRCGDVVHTLVSVYQEFLKSPEFEEGFSLDQVPMLLNGDGWLLIFVQLIHLLLVADFLYYYCKSLTYAQKESDQMTFEV